MNILTYTQPRFRYSFEALKIAIWSFSKKKDKAEQSKGKISLALKMEIL